MQEAPGPPHSDEGKAVPRRPWSTGPLRHRPFALLFAARAVSSLGDGLVVVALSFAVLELTGSVTDLGLVIGAQSAALVVFVLLGGVWSDRLARRSVMLLADAVRMVAQGISAALLIAGTAHVWQLVVLQAAYGAAKGFFSPASVAIVPEVAAPADLQPANALLGLSENATAVLGPAIAGVIVATTSPGWGLAADAASFFLSGVLLLGVQAARGAPAPSERSPSVIAELRDGWGVFRSMRWLWATVLYFTLYMGIVYPPFQVLGPAIARSSLGGAGAWAAITAAFGTGAVLGGLVGLRWRPAHPLRSSILMFLWASLLFVLLALHASLWTLILLAAIDGATSSIFNTFWFTAMQTRVSPGDLSRVSSWDHLGTLLLGPLGLAAVGPVAGALGYSATLYGAAAINLLLTLAVLAVREVRNLPGPELAVEETI
jgi:predicted MFS family arabinose efflux permease